MSVQQDRCLCINILGDEGIGKRTFIEQYVTCNWPEEVKEKFTHPKNGGPYNTRVIRGGASIQIKIHIDFINHMTDKNPQTDAVVVCFALDDPRTLQSAKTKWYPLLAEMNLDDVPVIFCGMKADQSTMGRAGEKLLRELPIKGL